VGDAQEGREEGREGGKEMVDTEHQASSLPRRDQISDNNDQRERARARERERKRVPITTTTKKKIEKSTV
jgi:hypothetical protein